MGKWLCSESTRLPMRFKDIASGPECTRDKQARTLEYCRWCPNCQIDLQIGGPHFHIHAQKLVPACSVRCLMKMKKDMKSGRLIDTTDITAALRDPSDLPNPICANGLLET